MGRINVMLRVSDDGKLARTNVFGISGIWGKEAITDKFYGTVAILSECMATHGALPGIVAMCPIAVPVNGSWLLRKVVEKITDSEDDIEATVFVDESTYRGILDCDKINDVLVIEHDSENTSNFTYRGWERGDTEKSGAYRIVRMTRKSTLDISEDDLTAEIERMETEMSDEPMSDKEEEMLDRIYGIISGGWKVFDRYGHDMNEFIRNTTPGNVTGNIDGDDYDGCLEDEKDTTESPDDYLKLLKEDAMDAPAPLRTVKLMASTLSMVGESLAKETEARKNSYMGLLSKLCELDERATGVIRDYEEASAVTREAVREEVGGLRKQLGLVIAERRAENLAFKICAIVSFVSMVGNAILFFIA